MDDRERLVIRYAHLGSGRNPRNREILARNRQVAQHHVEEIWAEQEAKNAALPDLTGQPTLKIAARYAAGLPRQRKVMNAERGWIADPPPQREHHTPGWLSEKGTGHSHFHPDKYVATEEHEHWEEKDGG